MHCHFDSFQPHQSLRCALPSRIHGVQVPLTQLPPIFCCVPKGRQPSPPFLAKCCQCSCRLWREISPPSRCPAGALERWPKRGCDRTCQAKLSPSVLDREAAHNFGDWLAAPLAHREPNAEVLVVHRTAAAAHRDDGANGIASFEELSAAVGAGLRMVRARQRLRQCAKQSETILSIVQQWSHTQEMETLLNQMAEASIQLLEADRASIFLWDRENHMLVGRPALGVPGGELRVPDDAGVVGEVLAHRRAATGFASRDARSGESPRRCQTRLSNKNACSGATAHCERRNARCFRGHQ